MAHCDGGQGQAKMAKKTQKHPCLWRYPQKSSNPKRKNIFSILTTRLTESLEGLNSSLAQLPGKLWDCKSLQKKQSRARQNFGASLQRCNPPPNWARELSKASSDSASLLLEIEKKIFVFGLGFDGGTAASGGVLAFFGHLYLALDHNPLGHYFGSRFSWKLGQNPASLEPLADFLAYREGKLWLINQKLSKILPPQKTLWRAFRPRQ